MARIGPSRMAPDPNPSVLPFGTVLVAQASPLLRMILSRTSMAIRFQPTKNPSVPRHGVAVVTSTTRKPKILFENFYGA